MILNVWQREWLGFSTTPRLWLLVVIAPLLLSALVLWIFSARTPANLPVLLVDYDHSAASRNLGRQLHALPSLAVISAAADLQAAASRIRRGEAYALVVIPAHFERDILRGDQPAVSFFYNRQMLTAGNMILRDVRTVVGTLGVAIGVEQGITPGVLLETHPAFNPGMDYTRFLALPMILAVLHIAMVVVAVDVIGRELREGTAGQWLASADGSWLRALIGKLLPYVLWFSVVGAAFLWLLIRSLGIAFHGNSVLWVISWVLLVLACFGLGTLLVGLIGNLRIALSIASVIVSPAFAYAGLTFPSAYMPPFAAFWSSLLPLTHGLAAHVQQAAMAAPATVTIVHLAALVPFIILPLLLAKRWQRLMTDARCWGAQ